MISSHLALLKVKKQIKLEIKYPTIDVTTNPIILGIAIMNKKLNGGPLKSILQIINEYKEIRIIVLEEKMLLSDPVESWPRCDALISFFSNGFPFTKVLRYVYNTKPYMINNLYFQRFLWDRRIIYAMLKHFQVPIPSHLISEQFCNLVIENDKIVYIDPKDIAFKIAHEKIYSEFFKKILALDVPNIEMRSKPNEEDEMVREVILS